MNIRPATLADCLPFKEMHLEFLKEVQQYGHDDPPSDHYVESVWSNHIGRAINKGEPVFVCEDCGDLIGFVACTLPTGGPRAFNHGLYVRPEWRRQGIALSLMEAAKARCREIGVEKIFDMVGITNEAALKLMAKLGEEPVAFTYKLTA